MIIEKAPPGLRRWLATANHVLGDGGLGNGYTKLRQLAVHAGRTPERIGLAHLPDQLAYFARDAGSSGPTSLALPRPMASEPGAVPPDHRLESHGFTMTRTLAQSVQILRKSTQNPRSTSESRGRFTEQWRTASCYRRARFSRASERRVLSAEMSEQRNDQIMPGCSRRRVRKIKCDTRGRINGRDRLSRWAVLSLAGPHATIPASEIDASSSPGGLFLYVVSRGRHHIGLTRAPEWS